MRTCIGCRQRERASVLVRLVALRGIADTAQVTIDERGRLPGRGAWLHRDERCLSLAVRRNAFGTALRDRGVAVKPTDLAEQLGAITSEGS
ncbi:YlxR family protein [Gordonia sp. (in: high G+C Gram-positive bacteria)]|uniref:YlxR family protein n=1 Tax=Gordonia sp. (in: high G+C Gram-positive bacteria) TaxID=84139 RepID=UPI003C7861A9